MDFKLASDTIRGTIPLDEQARRFGCSYQHFRRMRSDVQSKTRVPPPLDWPARMAEMMEEHARISEERARECSLLALSTPAERVD